MHILSDLMNNELFPYCAPFCLEVPNYSLSSRNVNIKVYYR